MGEHPWKAGRVLAGRYQLETPLGSGGMGAVWRAQHLVLQAPVAIKLMDPEIAGDADTISRFMREAQAAATLRSPHVVQIIDYGMDGLVPFMVMELLEGETLAERIRNAGRLLSAETLRIFTQVARAVQRAHEANIIHRDLKPENVFLVLNQDEHVAKVLDFGVAKMNVAHLGPSGARTKTGSLLGTPFYMSPEQAQGNKAVDHRSDLWSLGVIVFEMLTGRRPFYSDGLGDLVLQICVRDIPVPSSFAPVPDGFDGWFARATTREPDRRFQSAREMAEALREALGIEGRETLGTFPEASDSMRTAPVVVSGPVPVGSLATSSRVPALQGGRGSRPDDEDPAHTARAPTLLVPGGNKPSLTVQQFGTTSRSAPVKVGGPGPLVFGVAAVALAVGVAAGIMLLRQRAGNDPDRPLPVIEVDAGTREQPAELDNPIPEPPPLEQEPEEPEPRPNEGTPAVDSGAARTPTPETDPKRRPEEPVRPLPEASVAPPAMPDAGWVKPDWARPDDETPSAPSEPDTPSEPH
ncbi:MAG TPA: serine/threonine-protein kinase [Polyangiaceae bacterium]|nr:serine/threonine-protein kinase [Polyangiaceae bacterium]